MASGRSEDRQDKLAFASPAFCWGAALYPRVSLWMIATRTTLPELPSLVRFAAEVGVQEVYVQRLVLNGHGVAQAEESVHGRVDAQVRGWVADAEEEARRSGVALRASGRRPILESLTVDPGGARGCWRPWRSAVVTSSHKVLPCCISSFLAPYDELERGDLAEESWEDLWNGPRYQALRRGILSGDPLPFCASCGHAWSL